MNTVICRMRILLALVILLVSLLPGSARGRAVVETGLTERVSVSSDGAQGNNLSDEPAISANGRFVAFESYASNLVDDDTNEDIDIFVHDQIAGDTIRVSVASDGTQANGSSLNPSISGDGRLVAFESFATNLVEGDTNGYEDVFVHDLVTGETTRISIAEDGTQTNGMSFTAAISADRRYVAFGSFALNLIPGGATGQGHVFVHDRLTGEIDMVSVASDGTPGNSGGFHPSISSDGCFVSFTSDSNNLVDGDTNTSADIFVHDRSTHETVIVSVASDGTYGNSISHGSSISIDGRYIAFYSWASNLVGGDMNDNFDVFLHDRLTGETIRVSIASDGTEGNSASAAPSVAANGGYVTYNSDSSNLVIEDTNDMFDVFVYDRLDHTTTRISLASDGTQGSDESRNPSISADGASIAFVSSAPNLVAGDTNELWDVFVHDREGTYPIMLVALPLLVK